MVDGCGRPGDPANDDASELSARALAAARVGRREKGLGSLEPGKLADLVLVEGDPTARISDVRNVRMVVRDGAVYDPTKLCAEMGIRP